MDYIEGIIINTGTKVVLPQFDEYETHIKNCFRNCEIILEDIDAIFVGEVVDQ